MTFDDFADLNELYQEVILDHSRSPRNFRELPDADHRAEGYNPLCGDRIAVGLKLNGTSITEATFQGTGCAISMASASLMTQALKGRSSAEAERLFQAFHGMLTGEEGAEGAEVLGKLTVFAGVRKYPIRVKCATLAWHTMKAAMAGSEAPVTTE